jgi:outer membrane protein assembly factor BamE (lipoprotein component of BamABCDE complex)
LLLYFLFPFPLLLVAQHQAINISKTKHHKVYSQITKNKTTKSEITALLGEPDTRTTLDNGNEEWTYFMNNNQFDATTFIPIVGLLTGGSQTQAKRLEIEFKDETVRKWTFSENNSKMKTGLIQ